MKRSLEMPVADGRMDGTEFIGSLSSRSRTLGPKNQYQRNIFIPRSLILRFISLPEKIKTKKVEELVGILHDKKDMLDIYKIFKKTLNHGLLFKKMQKIV